MRRVKIADVANEPSTWNPQVSPSGEPFRYIDISSIDSIDKRIDDVVTIAPCDAPSRARQLVRRGDVLVSTVRPNLNAVALVPDELEGATASTGFAVLRPDTTRVDPIYLYYWIRSPQFVREMTARATGASYPAVTERVIRDSMLPLPPLTEQRRIAAVLDRADSIRRKRRKSQVLLDQFMGSVFCEMFGNPAPAWPIVTLESVTATGTKGVVIGPFGSDLRVEHYRATGRPVIFVRDVRPNRFYRTSSVFVSEEKFENLRAHQVAPLDVLVTKMGAPPGVAAVYPANMPVGIATADIIRVRCDTTRCSPYYLSAAVNGPHFQSRLRSITEGVTRPKLTLTDFREMKLPLPPLGEQRRFETALNRSASARDRIAQAELEAKRLFDSLAHRAFRGDL